MNNSNAYLDFQRGIVPHNFYVCASLFKTVCECRNNALRILSNFLTDVAVEECNSASCSITLHVNCKIAVFMNIQVLTMAKMDTKVKTRS